MLFILSNTTDSTIVSANADGDVHSFWFWLAIIEFVIIVILFAKSRKRNPNRVFSELDNESVIKSKNVSIDMDNLMASINNSNSLYKELSKKYHPDKFVNTSKQNIAQNIFQEITKHKRNYEKLVLLKEQAETQLDN